MHHPVPTPLQLGSGLKLLTTHPAEPGVWHDLRIAGGAIVPMPGCQGCGRGPLAQTGDSQVAWAERNPWFLTILWWFLEVSDAGLCSNVFESCCEKQAHGLGLASGKLCCHDSLTMLPGQILPSQTVQMGLHFSSSAQDSTGKALTRSFSQFPNLKALAILQTKRHAVPWNSIRNMNGHSYQDERRAWGSKQLTVIYILPSSILSYTYVYTFIYNTYIYIYNIYK